VIFIDLEYNRIGVEGANALKECVNSDGIFIEINL